MTRAWTITLALSPSTRSSTNNQCDLQPLHCCHPSLHDNDVFPAGETEREKDGESQRERDRVWGRDCKRKKMLRENVEKRAIWEEREIERERVVSRGLTYVNVFPVSVLAAVESWVNLGDRSKWRELVTLIDTGEGSSRWIAQKPTVPNTLDHSHTHTHIKPHYNEYSSHPQNAHTSQSSKSHYSQSKVSFSST